MRKIARIALWLYVFTVPWDMLTIEGAGTISRLSGLALLGTAALALAARPRVRKPGPVVLMATAFTALAGLSLLWTESYPFTQTRVFTYIQLLASVWIIQEFARTEQERRALLIAFCAGAFVPIIEVLNNYRIGAEAGAMTGRYSAAGLNPNDLGLTLAVGLPIAWHLRSHSPGMARWMGMAYFALAPLGILLSATRGALLTALVALSIIPLTLPRESLRVVLRAVVVLLLVALPATAVVPSSIWNRMLTIGQELQGHGGMSGRSEIWKAGLDAFPERPLLGSGAGTYAIAIQRYFGGQSTSHNVPLTILVEHGIIGFLVFGALLGACAWTIFQLPPANRTMWAVLGAAWVVGVMSLNWEYRKVTWLFFGLIAAQSPGLLAARLESSKVRAPARERVRPSPWPLAHPQVRQAGRSPARPRGLG